MSCVLCVSVVMAKVGFNVSNMACTFTWLPLPLPLPLTHPTSRNLDLNVTSLPITQYLLSLVHARWILCNKIAMARREYRGKNGD